MHSLSGIQIFWLPLSSQRLWFNPFILMSLIDKRKECDKNKTIICVYKVKKKFLFFSDYLQSHSLVHIWSPPDTIADRKEVKISCSSWTSVRYQKYITLVAQTIAFTVTLSLLKAIKLQFARWLDFTGGWREMWLFLICFWTFSWYWEFHETKWCYQSCYKYLHESFIMFSWGCKMKSLLLSISRVQRYFTGRLDSLSFGYGAKD